MNNKSLTIIGLVGKKQSGKDTTCKLLREMCVDRRIVRLSYGDLMKLELANLLIQHMIFDGMAGMETNEDRIKWIDNLKENVSEFRFLLQEFYQRRLLESGLDYWDRQLAEKFLSGDYTQPTIVVVTDVRYPKQAAWINSQGGVLWRIRRPDVDKENTDTHSSETELESISPDKVFFNTGDVKQLAGTIYLSIRHFKLTFGQNIKHYEDIDYTKL